MIPKKIHYCWFGGKPLPKFAIKCIESWKKHFPDYDIVQWNESNFDVNICNYTKEAYMEKKYAFVSDYARFYILYYEGGVYFDTDVEVIRGFDDIICQGPFMGCEEIMSNDDKTQIKYNPASGLGIGAPKGLNVYKEIIEHYNEQHFIDEYGNYIFKNNTDNETKILRDNGFDCDKQNIQKVAGIYIYPPEYFCPMNDSTGQITITKNTHSIHYYSLTWTTHSNKIAILISRHFNGKSKISQNVCNVLTLPFKLISQFEEHGIRKTIRYIYIYISNRFKNH